MDKRHNKENSLKGILIERVEKEGTHDGSVKYSASDLRRGDEGFNSRTKPRHS